MVPSQQPLPHVPGGQPQPTHTLPPVPISFARRRAGLLGGKKKPADIVISPREAHTPDQLAPAIQSAPPVPHAGQSSFYSGRFAMALPRLPSAMGGGDSVRRVASNVPPTPTRLSMLGGAAPSTTVAGISGRSPPAASVPISSVRVPPTPASLHHPSYSNDKSAFLAPFEVFYDALNDSKQLKTWLGEQLQRSNMIVQSLTQQQEKLGETVEALVEKKMAPVRSEVTSLRRRVEELEDALRAATYDRRHSVDNTLGAPSKGKQPLRNGIPPGPVAPETYTFPPVPPSDSRQARPELIRRQSSPGWPPQQQQEREARGNQHMTDSDAGSPAPYESRRQSVSASRLEPHPIPRSHSHTSSEMPHPRGPIVQVQSPPQVYREGVNHALPPPSSVNSSHSAKARGGAHERPSLSRQASYTNASPAGGENDSPIPRHADSRRSSIAPEES
ncbi:hypothetical protein BDQ12DRAFT_679760 [Crucibulum laeve]|uniref:Uncharacterized protein n=1 Tax=Crucibulum laeve TaxID=68775 RepID=A0A5C3M6Y1_9AGAR|nr:hypothetical protein BDQ12DRAFT_679760 [Crucibulum laeve]